MTTFRPLALASLGLALALAAFPAQAAAAPKATPAARAAEAPAWKTATLRRPADFAETVQARSGVLVVGAASAAEAGERVAALVTPEGGAAARSAAEAAKFDFKGGETLVLRALGGLDQVVLMGVDKGADAPSLHAAGEALGRALAKVRAPVTVAAGPVGSEGLAALATGFGIGEYRSDLLSSDRPDQTPEPVTFVGTGAAGAEAIYRGRGLALVEAVQWARDVSNLPANLIYPQTFVDAARAAFAGIPGVSIEVLDEAEMKRLGMGSISGVGMGSVRPPRLLVVRYRGAGATAAPPLVFAGKGITFDSGGISIKAASGMGEMKMDMSGAASVTGAVLSLAKSGAPVNVVAVSALAENMPDGGAIRPGDVLTAMNGKTIEVISTDAEGRLVLADALVWSERNLKPAAIVDLATLTGAVRTALGDDYAGLFGRGRPCPTG